MKSTGRPKVFRRRVAPRDVAFWSSTRRRHAGTAPSLPVAVFFSDQNFETSSRVFTQVCGNQSNVRRLPAHTATTKPFAGRGREKPMFKIPAYDPFAIAVMGFGILLAAAFAYPP
jgi:hypothetical protein